MRVLPPAGAPLDLRLVPGALAAWLVAWQGRLLPPRLLLTAAAVLAVLALALLVRRSTVAAAVLGCAAAAAAVTGLHVESRTTGPLAQAADARAAVTAEAVLTDDPRRATSDPELVVVRLRVVELRSAGRTHRLRSPVVLLSSEPAWLDLLPSQRVRVQGRLRPAERGDDVAAVLSGRGAPTVLTPPSRLQRVAGHLRAGLRQAADPLPAAERGLLPGLVVGDTSRLDPDLREDFRTVGLSHLTAVSGTNVAIVTGAVLLLARRGGVGLRGSPVLAAVALAGFVVLARPSPSVLRAAVMGLVGLAALSTGGRAAAVPALSTAVLVLVLVDPDLAAAPGFALSVLATGGLVVLAPGWRAALSRRLPGWLADALAVPAAAQVACGPVVVAMSAELGLLSVPANLLAVPAVAPATVLGVAAALLAPVWLPAAQALAWVAWLPTAWLVLVARTGARLPGAAAPWPGGATGALLLAGADRRAAAWSCAGGRGGGPSARSPRGRWRRSRRSASSGRRGRHRAGSSSCATSGRATRSSWTPAPVAPWWSTSAPTRGRSTAACAASTSGRSRWCCSPTTTPTTSTASRACSAAGPWAGCRSGRSTSPSSRPATSPRPPAPPASWWSARRWGSAGRSGR